VVSSSGGSGPVAEHPSQPAVADALGGTTGPLVSASPGVILSLGDSLGIFNGTSGALPGFSAYQPITGTVPPAGKILSSAGPSTGSAAVAAWRLGHGIVIEVGIAGFGGRVGRSVDAQELTRRLWTILSH
jgi:hypothetical protein